ncbi:translation factor SUA5 [Devosia enhydra]|uniref:Threonylcarbamoyl-AMP synthase n=1 Tax=Devosia enhydra TaxID=665118 RepID=A0A1K2I2S3_9HYPH|nr:L-threonylcarbamoyladenylate synthase [Devosia enhydra]SFZ86060.1 translation factor SUA5 [Devosia enhydra]
MQSQPDLIASIGRFAALLRSGEVVGMPTETVYGLAADATNPDAVLKIYETKGRPRFNPLIVHCADLAMAERFALFDDLARRLAERFWPGPLTLVLPLKDDAGLSDLVTAGLDTVALRVPAHPIAQALIRAADRPIAAPSANPSGRLSPTTAQQVIDGFGGAVPVLDGGPCEAGVESTILAIADGAATQLRAGALPRDVIEAAIGTPVAVARADAAIAAPGMLLSHYAPRAHLRLDAAVPEPGEAYLAFGNEPQSATSGLRNLSATRDLREAARNLFSMLHQLDAEASGIAVAPIPETGLGEAINDRLRRAAAPRS